MVHTEIAPYHVQFTSCSAGGPTIVVKNTFLDCDESAPTPIDLRRGKTAPAMISKESQAERCHSRSTSTSSVQERGLSQDSDEEADRPAAEMPLFTAPSAPGILSRYTTYDSFEQDSGDEPGVGNSGALMPCHGHDGLLIPCHQTPYYDMNMNYESLPVMTPVLMPLFPQTIPQGTPQGMPQCMLQGPEWAENQGMVQMLQHAQSQFVQQQQQQNQFVQSQALRSEFHQQGTQVKPETEQSGFSREPAGMNLHKVNTAARQPQTLTTTMRGDICHVHWTIDARKLHGSDRVAVSPPFELACGAPVTFKMMVSPKVSFDGKGGASFRKARGCGIVQLKCEAQVSEVIAGSMTFRLSIGSGFGEKAVWQEARGPVQHNFTKSGICGLPKDEEEWDFNSVVDESSQTFVVCLEVLAHAA